jgi:peptide/nickel transport system permease protein
MKRSAPTVVAIGKYFLLALTTLVFLSLVIYVATLVVPADPAKIYLGKTASEEQIRAFREQQGLDRGVVLGYVDWAREVAVGNWGTSIYGGDSVTSIVLPALARSSILVLFAFLLAVPVSLLLGVFTGRRASSASDLSVSSGLLVTASLPDFVIGVILLWVFAATLGWFPVSSAVILFGSPEQAAKAYVLPALTLALTVIPHISRQVRGAVREASATPHVRAASLRGLSNRRVVWRHVVPTSLSQVVNVIALNLPELLAGVVVVETVFAFPGIGYQFIQAITQNDVAIVQAIALIIGTVYVASSFAADSLVAALNPRLRRSHG